MEPFEGLRAGDRIAEKFRIERVLGEGGMGVVYLAVHEVLGERFAIKVLRAEATGNTEAVTRFMNEARASIRVKNEHIAAVMDVGTLPDGAAYMVMEYLDGEDLSQVLENRGPLPVEETVDYVLQALEGLAYAHAEGIVHRDLKPANLFLTRTRGGDTVVKLLDFGISKLAAQQLAESNQAGMTSTSAMLGSPGYMSPEQVRSSRDVDARADLWAVGVILHRLLSGAPPFEGETLGGVLSSILEKTPEPIRKLRADVPDGLEAVISRCLVKDRELRWPNAHALAEALVPFGPPGGQERAERMRRLLGVPSRKSDASAPRATPPPQPAATQSLAEAPTQQAASPREAQPSQAQTPAPSPSPATSPATSPSKPGGRAPLFAALAVGAIGIAAGVYFFVSRSAEPRAGDPVVPSTRATTSASGAARIADASAAHPPAKVRRDGGTSPGDGSLAAQQAVHLLEAGCKQGKTQECIRLARHYQDGSGVTKDVKHAAQLFEEACDKDFGEACTELGVILASGEKGIPEDDERAAKLYLKACDLEDASGCTQAGLAFSSGDGVAKDEKRALSLLEKGCTGEDGEGCSSLGHAYEDGTIVKTDPARAIHYFELGCKNGYDGACVAFGWRLVKGTGVKEDRARGIELLRKSCKTNAHACEKLAELDVAP